MELFKSFISVMAYASLGFSFSAAYLKINKIWKRKHIEEVANSVSIAGNVVDIIPLTIFALNFMIVAQWQGLIDSLVWIAAGVVSVFIGSGFWVHRYRGKSFWTRFKEAIKLEGSEVGDLATRLFRPSSAETILKILSQFAYIDQNLGRREQEFIQSFADNWHMDIDWYRLSELGDVDRSLRYVNTRETVSRYIRTSPPVEQVSQLIDVLQSLVEIDDTVSAQEELMLGEVNGLLLDYMDPTNSPMKFAVVIAPQSRDQDVAIASLLPQLQKIEVAGGSGYKIGSFYSQDYANLICDQYRALGYFTIDMASDVADPA